MPTLVLHRTGDRCLRVEEGRYVASLIPGARFVELPGDDHLPFVGDQDAILDEIERFLAELARRPDASRVLATVLCVDTGDGTAPVEALHALVAAEASPFGRAAVQIGGDRVFARFDGPARAIRCGCAISRAARRTHLLVRVGLHTGECDLAAGMPARASSPSLGARVATLARPVRCWSRARWWISSPAPVCDSPTAACTSSRTAISGASFPPTLPTSRRCDPLA